MSSTSSLTKDKNMNRKRPPLPLHDDDDVVASNRKCRRKSAMAAKWDVLQTPIIIEIISWLDQDSLMSLSLVSKQLYNIISDEPGNKNKIIPVFEVSGNSTVKLLLNLSGHFRNKKIKNKLQSYKIMRIKDVHKFSDSNISIDELAKIAKNVQMVGVTSLDLSIQSPRVVDSYLPYILPDILSDLREINLSSLKINMKTNTEIIMRFSRRCPLLEKITLTNNNSDISLSGHELNLFSRLKELHMDNSVLFDLYADKFDDLNNHQDVFLFHLCTNALERVSIRNMNYYYDFYDGDDDDHDIEIMISFTQNALIKFVRNAPSSMRWFRSDLTLENMNMLRMERPGIELLN
jgi:hypothetical protein